MKRLLLVVTMTAVLAGCASPRVGTGTVSPSWNTTTTQAMGPKIVYVTVVSGQPQVDDPNVRIEAGQPLHFRLNTDGYQFAPGNKAIVLKSFVFGDPAVDLLCHPDHRLITCDNRKQPGGALHSYTYTLSVIDAQKQALHIDPWINNY